MLTLEGAKLFCNCCHTKVGSSKQAAKTHVNSAQHKINKSRAVQRLGESGAMQDNIASYAKAASEAGMAVEGLGTVDPSNQEFRGSLLKEFLKAGIAPSKLRSDETLIHFLEKRVGSSFGEIKHVIRTFLPILAQEILTENKKRLCGRHLGILDDATTYCGEILAIVGRLIDLSTLEAETPLLALPAFAKSVDHRDLTSALARQVGVRLGVDPDLWPRALPTAVASTVLPSAISWRSFISSATSTSAFPTRSTMFWRRSRLRLSSPSFSC